MSFPEGKFQVIYADHSKQADVSDFAQNNYNCHCNRICYNGFTHLRLPSASAVVISAESELIAQRP